MGGWSEEEYLLGHDNYSSNMYSNYHGDLPRNSSNKDVYHKHKKMMETQKYLRESCYHRIECIVVTFLVAFMLRRPLNNTALATITHRKPERMSNGTNTQVRVQITNKCRIKMAQTKLYNVRDPP